MHVSSGFFRLLSEDLQAHVFQTWFEDAASSGPALKALSSLDVACSSHNLRQPFLLLISILHLKGRATNMKYNKDMSRYMRWLADRGVAVSSLHIPILADSSKTGGMLTRVKKFFRGLGFSPRRELVLPYITELSLGSKREPLTAAFNMTPYLAACPNAAWLDIHSMSIDDGAIWNSLAAANLTIIKLTVYSVNFSMSPFISEFCFMLQQKGALLEELTLHMIAMVDEHLLNLLSVHCQQLRRLHCAIRQMLPIACIVNLINAFPLLSDIHIINNLQCVEDVVAILAAGSPHQIKKFSVGIWNGGSIAECATVLERHPWLECWNVPYLHWAFVRASHNDNSLTIATDLDEHIVQQILGVCEDLTQLQLFRYPESTSLPALASLTDRVGESLLDVSLNSAEPKFCSGLVQLIPLRCPNLQRFSSVNFQLTDRALEEIACVCTHLEHVVMDATHGASLPFGDTGLIALFNHCLQLKTVDIGGARGGASTCTKSCLEAMLVLKVRLVRLTFHAAVGINKMDVDSFRELAKQLQLMPVPIVQCKNG